MEKSFTIKTQDKGVFLNIAMKQYGSARGLGIWRGWELSQSDKFYFAEKGDELWADRGLTGLLETIDKVDKASV